MPEIRTDLSQSSIDDEPTLRDYLGILRRRSFVIATAFLVTLGITLGSSLGRSPVFRATTTVVADRPGGVIALFPDVAGAGQSYIDTLAEIVKSRAVAERAAQALGFAGPDAADMVRDIQKGISVQRIRFTDMIQIDASGGTSQEASRIADALAQGIIDLSLEARRAQASAARKFIEDQLGVVTKDLRTAEEAMARYKAEGGNVSLSEETSLKLTKLAEFEAQLAATRTERQSVEAQLNRARAELQKLSKIAPATWTASPLIAPLRQQLASLEVELAGLQEQFTAKHPAILATRAKIAETKTRLSEQLLRNLDAQTYAVDPVYQHLSDQIIQAEVARYALSAKEAALSGVIERWSGAIRDLPPRELTLARLTRDQKVAEQVYLLLSSKLQEARIAEASVVSDIRIIDRADLPLAPVEPNMRKNLALGGILGLLLGIVGAFGMETLDRTFRSSEEAERFLGVPLLGVIPHTNRPNGSRNGRRKARGIAQKIPFIARMDPKSPFVEANRTLRTNLLYSAPEGSLRAVLVTSACPGEGKTMTAANLAASLAQLSGLRVALFECDLRRPGLAELFGTSMPVGLSDYLVGERSVAGGLTETQVIYKTPIDGLDIIPAGRSTPNPSELLASGRLRALLTSLRQRYDLLVIDSPAMLAVADATIVSRHTDGAVLVVRAGSTEREAALRARHQIEAVGAKVIGFVYNDASPGAQSYALAYHTYGAARPARETGAD